MDKLKFVLWQILPKLEANGWKGMAPIVKDQEATMISTNLDGLMILREPFKDRMHSFHFKLWT
jgi:hypothetical protein